MNLTTILHRALDANPFDPDDDPDRYRRWEAASDVHSAPSTVRVVWAVAHDLPAARQRHAAAEGIEYPGRKRGGEADP
jgi:hypothetical protein